MSKQGPNAGEDITSYHIRLAREAHRRRVQQSPAAKSKNNSLHESKKDSDNNSIADEFTKLDSQLEDYEPNEEQQENSHAHHDVSSSHTSSAHNHHEHTEHKHSRFHAHKANLQNLIENYTRKAQFAIENTLEYIYDSSVAAHELFSEKISSKIKNKLNQRKSRIHKEENVKRTKDSEAKKKFLAYFETAGYTQTHSEILHNLNYLSIFLTIVAFIYYASTKIQIFDNIGYSIFVFLVFCIIGYPVMLLTVMLAAYAYTDFRIVQRKENIEKHFPEFLHVVAANIRAGMTIDQALWRAARPQFGMLSKEIEIVAKKSMIGHDLSTALKDFGRKYDSKVVRRSISLIVEGMDSGSEIGAILENVSLNLEDLELRKQSMAANVTTYVIFIVFAVVIAAPLLFAVATQLLTIVQNIGERVSQSGAGSSTKGLGISFSLSTEAVLQSDFLIFCIVMLMLTCTMSSVIISAIKTGKAWGAVKDLPIFWVVSIAAFLIVRYILASAFTDII